MERRHPHFTVTAQSRREAWSRLGIPSDYSRVRHLPLQREARALVAIRPAEDDRQLLYLTPRAARAWRRMFTAARADGVTLLPLSAYRSVERQIKIIERKLAAGDTITDILRYVAAPGCSEHHTGRAIDLGSPHTTRALEEDFALTPEFRWLTEHAGCFGFSLSYPCDNPHGISYEPWHWCWRAR
jgi:D-alanyl-D-alanine carboxypeptidase